MDSSLIDANASNNSVIDTKGLKHQLHMNYKKLEARLTESNESPDSSKYYEKKNSRYISSTDPDATIVNRGKPKLSYQVHRAVDGKNEVITATDATSGAVTEAHLMLPLLEKHEAITGFKADTVVADSKLSPCPAYPSAQLCFWCTARATRRPRRLDIKTRQHLMERSFAQATRYDFDQARWRGLWRMRIQELLVCSIQNIQILIKQTNKPKKIVAAKARALKTTLNELISPV